MNPPPPPAWTEGSPSEGSASSPADEHAPTGKRRLSLQPAPAGAFFWQHPPRAAASRRNHPGDRRAAAAGLGPGRHVVRRPVPIGAGGDEDAALPASLASIIRLA